MAKCDWYVVSVHKTMCGAVKIRKRKVTARPCCSCCCFCDLLIKAFPYITIVIIGSVVGCQLAHVPNTDVRKSILEVREGANILFSITQEVK